jgi:hypothetical protein
MGIDITYDLQKHYEQGVNDERERIIALIMEITNSIPMKTWSNTDLWYLREDILNKIKEVK